jgi:hypothetical protein
MIVYRPVDQSWWWKLLNDGSTVALTGPAAPVGQPSTRGSGPRQSGEKLSAKGGAGTDLGAR